MKRRPHHVEAGYRPYETITGLNLADDPIWRGVYVWQRRCAVLAVLLCAAVALLIVFVITHSPARTVAAEEHQRPVGGMARPAGNETSKTPMSPGGR